MLQWTHIISVLKATDTVQGLRWTTQLLIQMRFTPRYARIRMHTHASFHAHVHTHAQVCTHTRAGTLTHAQAHTRAGTHSQAGTHTHIRTHIHTPLYTQHARASLSLCFSLSLPLFLSFFLSLPLGKGETKGVESKEEKKKRRKEEGKKTTRRHPWTTQLFYALIDLSTCTVNSGLLNYRRDGS